METINKIIVNCETNETEIIPLTANELKTLKEEAAKQQKSRLALEAEAETKAAEKQAILDRIGLTADELKTILG